MLHGVLFLKDCPKFFSDGARRVYFKFLGEVGDVKASWTDEFSSSRFNLTSNDFELSGFARTVDADKTDAIAHFYFPIDILENFACGVDFTDMFESQHQECLQGGFQQVRFRDR